MSPFRCTASCITRSIPLRSLTHFEERAITLRGIHNKYGTIYGGYSHTMTPTQLERARRLIAAWKWTVAKTMPQWPHEYVVYSGEYDGDDPQFEYVEKLIERFGYDDKWGRQTRRYLVIDSHKYWVHGHILNRAAPLKNADVLKRGEKYLERNGMRTGPFGRPVRG